MTPAALLLASLAIASGAFVAVFYGDVTGHAFFARETAVLVVLGGSLGATLATLSWRARTRTADRFLLVRDGNVLTIRTGAPHQKGRNAVALVVESGQAVVLERYGRFSRVLPPGLGQLLPGETVYKIVPTRSRTLQDSVECATKDAIPLNVQFEVSAAIMPAPARTDSPTITPPDNESRPTTRPGLAPAWSEDAVVRAAYETHSWEAAVLTTARSMLREECVRAYLDDVIDLHAVARPLFSLDALEERTRAKLSATARSWGVNILGFRILQATPPEEVTRTALSQWQTRRRPNSLQRTRPQPTAAIRIAPLVQRGPFRTLRQALRDSQVSVLAGLTVIGGRDFVGRPLGELGTPSAELRPDRTYFAMQVHGQSLSDLNAADGDYLLMESAQEASHGDVVAVALDGQVSLRRYWNRADHTLLQPEAESQPLTVLVETPRLIDVLQREYSTHEREVEVREATDAKILGRAVLTFKDTIDLRAEVAPSETQTH